VLIITLLEGIIILPVHFVIPYFTLVDFPATAKICGAIYFLANVAAHYFSIDWMVFCEQNSISCL
jgi:hypothetical protein